MDEQEKQIKETEEASDLIDEITEILLEMDPAELGSVLDYARYITWRRNGENFKEFQENLKK